MNQFGQFHAVPFRDSPERVPLTDDADIFLPAGILRGCRRFRLNGNFVQAGIIAVPILPEFELITNEIRCRHLRQLQGGEVSAFSFPDRMHEQTRPILLENVRKLLEFLISVSAGENALAPEDPERAAEFLEHAMPEGCLMDGDSPLIGDRIDLRIMRPGKILAA